MLKKEIFDKLNIKNVKLKNNNSGQSEMKIVSNLIFE